MAHPATETIAIVHPGAGPSAGTLTRQVTVPGGRALLAVVVDLQAIRDPKSPRQLSTAEQELLARLVEGMARAFQQPGSVTGRARAALAAADAWLRRLAKARDEPAGSVGASLLVVAGQDAILAQAGPAMAAVASEDELVRYPEHSPWLAGEAVAPATSPLWAPLGAGRELSVHWARWPLAPGQGILLCGSIPPIPDESLVALLQTPPARAEEALARTLPDTPALLLTVASPAAMPAYSLVERAGVLRRTTTIGTIASAVLPPLATGWRQVRLAAGRLGVRLRAARQTAAVLLGPVIRRVARTTARILLNLLPARAIEKHGARRELARLAAVAAVALPVAVVVLTLYMRARAATPVPAPAGQTTPAVPAQDDTATLTTRLADASPLASVTGADDDERHVVATADSVYVLNADADHLERIVDGAAQRVLSKGDAVGELVVGELVDLVRLRPQAGGQDRVAVLDGANNWWTLDGADVAPLTVAFREMWLSVYRADGFDGRLYVLDRGEGQIWRYDPAPGGYLTPPEPWLSEETDLSKALDMAIDGAIYVLFEQGVIRKYQDGRPVPFEVGQVPGGMAGARSLYTSPTAGRLLVADAGGSRVVVLSPTGDYLGQLLRPPLELATDPVAAGGLFADIHSVWWEEETGALYVVSGNDVYRATYHPLAP